MTGLRSHIVVCSLLLCLSGAFAAQATLAGTGEHFVPAQARSADTRIALHDGLLAPRGTTVVKPSPRAVRLAGPVPGPHAASGDVPGRIDPRTAVRRPANGRGAYLRLGVLLI